jgi:acetyl-CoA synthetase
MTGPKAAPIDNVMKEDRLFPPPKEFTARARIGSVAHYEKLWKEATGDPATPER